MQQQQILSFEKYCLARLNKHSERLNAYEEMVELGQISGQQYIEIANGLKKIMEFEKSMDFYNWCVANKNHFVVISNSPVQS
jgi:hypothetical protein